MDIPRLELERIVQAAVLEDLGWGDITTRALIPRSWRARGKVIFKEEGLLVGGEVFALVFGKIDAELETELLLPDGMWVGAGETVARVEGRAGSILAGERIALNFLQHLSGIATEVSRYVKAVEGLPVRIIDTRKTTPGLRALEKYAVRAGGGHNHRQNLSDGVLIKDNHLTALRAAGFSMQEIVAQVRNAVPHTVRVEVEVESTAEAEEAAKAGTDAILLDNMSVEEMRSAVAQVAGRAILEASGGVTLSNLREIAETGVDLISSSAFTLSAKALDINLELEWLGKVPDLPLV